MHSFFDESLRTTEEVSLFDGVVGYIERGGLMMIDGWIDGKYIPGSKESRGKK